MLRGCERVRQAELMDSLGLDEMRHRRALGGLARMNWLSAAAAHYWRPIRTLAHRSAVDRLRILDVATGGGDVPARLWTRGRSHGLKLEILAVDRSVRAIQFGRQMAARRNIPIRFRVLDAVRDPLPEGFDVVTCSLFLHHLSDGEARLLLTAMARSSGRLLLVQDLLRSRAGRLLAGAATRLFTTSDVVRIDAARSLAAAFTLDEARRLARSAGLDGARAGWRWPWRFLLEWSPP